MSDAAPKLKRLTRLQRAFCSRVVLGEQQTRVMRELQPHLTAPAIKASKWMALPQVKAEIARLEDDALHSAGITRAMIVNEFRRIGFANLFDEHGAPKDLAKLDEDTRAAVSSIEYSDDGKVKRVRTWSKREALSELAAIAGLKREQAIAPQNIGPGLTVIVQQAVQVNAATNNAGIGPSQTRVVVSLPPPST
jgi:uncharacterized protein YjiS (DUF1127 family)